MTSPTPCTPGAPCEPCICGVDHYSEHVDPPHFPKTYATGGGYEPTAICAAHAKPAPSGGADALPRLGHRPLTAEPLTADDWKLVYFATLGYQKALKAIVDMARKRTRMRPPIEGGAEDGVRLTADQRATLEWFADGCRGDRPRVTVRTKRGHSVIRTSAGMRTVQSLERRGLLRKPGGGHGRGITPAGLAALGRVPLGGQDDPERPAEPAEIWLARKAGVTLHASQTWGWIYYDEDDSECVPPIGPNYSDAEAWTVVTWLLKGWSVKLERGLQSGDGFVDCLALGYTNHPNAELVRGGDFKAALHAAVTALQEAGDAE